ncbi:MAG: L,D-transpeptidase [Candidatus Azobacteroides sp.]|nr:L,D-transpeptidase [Candidatus Azobacteroides sp.]
MNKVFIYLGCCFLLLNACTGKTESTPQENIPVKDSLQTEEKKPEPVPVKEIVIEKQFLYDQHTLEDTYPYKDTTRTFQWEKIKKRLFLLDSIQTEPSKWAILQNYKNKNGEAPLIKNYKRNEYKRVADTLGVERYQSVPLFLSNDTTTGVRYGRDGTLVKFLGETGNYIKVRTLDYPGEWLVPKKYVKQIGDTVSFRHAIMVDVSNQNIATLEKEGSKWLVRSMNPATTGVHNPPYAQETPVGMFIIQERKPKMIYLKDGSKATGGYAPYASRFTNGAYIHGVPINAPRTKTVEFSPTLGTTPRSHMCVRNATSHAKFVYDWAPVEQSIVFVFD